MSFFDGFKSIDAKRYQKEEACYFKDHAILKSKEKRDEEIGNSDIGVHVIEFFQVHSDHLFRGVYSLDWYTSK